MFAQALDLANAKRIIGETPPGFYGARDVYGDDWELVDDPWTTARQFRRWVGEGRLPRVKLRGRRANRSPVYEVLGSTVH